MDTQPCKPLPQNNFHRLRFLSIIGGFLDGQTFEFSDGLNCLIGARGTGKTTALELIRYALDMPAGRESDAAESRRIESLIQKNLGGGRIQVGIETKDGLSYIVSRCWGEDPIVLNAEGLPTEVTLRSGGVFKADIFSQNEIERIADRTTSQLSLVDNFEAQGIAGIEAELQQVRLSLDANAGQVIPLESRLASLKEELSTLPHIEKRLEAYSTEPGDDANELNAAHARKSLRDREQRASADAQRILEDMARDIGGLVGRVSRGGATLMDPEVAQGPNAAMLSQITEELSRAGKDIDQLLTQAKQRIIEAQQTVAAQTGKLLAAHREQELAFRALIEKHRQSQGQAEERMQLEKHRNDLLAKRRMRDEVRQKLAALQQERGDLLAELSELRDKRFAIRQAVAGRINESLSPAIRVSLTQFGNPECYRLLLENSLRGTRMKFNIVAQKLANAFWPAELSKAIADKDVPTLVAKAELNQDQADKVIAALSGSEILYQLETVELMDEPRIQLRDGENYKDSLTLSTGQKCTAILPILLLDSENPLLVDQPEDNLDNRFIFETVVGSIRRIKRCRQLLFVTHNPNIPVLADAERVFVLDSNGSSARKANEGSVDQCKPDIITLLEGGEEAFRRRKERYAC